MWSPGSTPLGHICSNNYPRSNERSTFPYKTVCQAAAEKPPGSSAKPRKQLSYPLSKRKTNQQNPAVRSPPNGKQSSSRGMPNSVSKAPGSSQKVGQGSEFYMSLVKPSPELEEIARGTTKHQSGYEIGYGLLTRWPLPLAKKIEVATVSTTHLMSVEPCLDVSGEREVIKFSAQQKQMIEDYSQSFLGSHANWRVLFEGLPSDFWAGTLLLPVYHEKAKAKWSLAWGIISATVSFPAQSCLVQLLEGIGKNGVDEEKTKKLMKEVRKCLGFPLDYSPVGDTAGFLKMFPVKMDGSELLHEVVAVNAGTKGAQDVELRPMLRKRYLFNDLMYQWGVENQEEARKASSKTLCPVAIPIEWIRMGYLCSALLPTVVNYTRMTWIKGLYPALKVLDNVEMVKAFMLAPADNQRSKRLQNLGSHVSYFLFLSDLLVQRECTLHRPSEAQSMAVQSGKLAVAKRLPFNIQLLFLKIDLRSASVTASHSIPWNNLSSKDSDKWKYEEGRVPQEPLLKYELNIIGQGIHALMAVCYLHGGIQLARRFAIELGIFRGPTVLNDLEGQDVDPLTYSYPWEAPRLQPPCSLESTEEMLSKVASSFGYRFNVWERLAHASTHYALARKAHCVSFFQGLDFLGHSALMVVISSYLLREHPTEEQTSINRIFSMSVLQEIMGRIVGEHGLDLAFAHDPSLHGKDMRTARSELEGSEPGKLTRFKPPRIWIKIFHAVAGAILMDSCFNLESLERAVLPVAEPFLKDALGFHHETEIFTSAYQQFIPTHVLPSVYKKAVASKKLYATIVRFSDALGGGSSGTDRGFILLSGKALVECPEFDVNYPPLWSTSTCQVSIELHPDEALTFTDEQIQLIEGFQNKFYEDMVVPCGMIKKYVGRPEKLYSIMPAVKQTEIGNENWEIDWNLVNNVVTGSVPTAWKEIIPLCLDDNANESALVETVEKVNSDSAFEEPPSNWTSKNWPSQPTAELEPRLLHLLQAIVWKTKKGALICLSGIKQENGDNVQHEGQMGHGPLVNAFGILNCLPERHDKHHGTFEWPWEDVLLKNCRPTHFSVSSFRRAWVLPSVLHRLEMHLLADDFRTMYPVSQNLPLNVLTTSLTCESAQDLDPELLSVIGTAVVQYIIGAHLFTENRNLRAGQLSGQLSAIVEGSIVEKEERRKIAGHLSSAHFNPHKAKTAWCPPGVNPFRIAPQSHLSEGLSELPKARLKGPVLRDGRWVSRAAHIISESIVNSHVRIVAGALFLHAGLRPSEKFLMDLGVIKASDMGSTRRLRVQSSKLFAVEKSLGYEFNNMEILAESLVHPSVGAPKDYNRLEFIGDLTLEVLIVRYIRALHENITMERSFRLKTIIVANETLGRIAMSKPLCLHKVLHHKVPNMEEEFRSTELKLDSLDNQLPGDLRVELPKVAGDIFESVIGAVLVDSGFDLEVVWGVAKPLFKDFFEKWIENPEWLWERIQSEEPDAGQL